MMKRNLKNTDSKLGTLPDRFEKSAIILVPVVLVLLGVIGYLGSTGIKEAETANGGPINIYLPAMPFLLFEDGESDYIHHCKKLAFDTVDEFSQAVHSNLVRQDRKLRVLAGIVLSNCFDLQVTQLRSTKE